MRQCPTCLKPIDWHKNLEIAHHGDHVSVYCNVACRKAHETRKPPRINHIMLAVLVALAAVIGIVWAAGAQPPPNTSGAYKEWFEGQKRLDEEPNVFGEYPSCCGSPEEEGGDGHFVNVRYVGHDEEIGDRYEVQIGDNWYLYPRPVPRAVDNITGRNVAWYVFASDGKSIIWYCLRIALGV